MKKKFLSLVVLTALLNSGCASAAETKKTTSSSFKQTLYGTPARTISTSVVMAVALAALTQKAEVSKKITLPAIVAIVALLADEFYGQARYEQFAQRDLAHKHWGHGNLYWFWRELSRHPMIKNATDLSCKSGKEEAFASLVAHLKATHANDRYYRYLIGKVEAAQMQWLAEQESEEEAAEETMTEEAVTEEAVAEEESEHTAQEEPAESEAAPEEVAAEDTDEEAAPESEETFAQEEEEEV